MQNYSDIALCSNVGNLEAMKSACMDSMYRICGYHVNYPKSADTWCQYQNDKENNTKYYKSKDVRRAILPFYQSLCKSVMFKKYLHGETQKANESFNGMISNCVPKATHIGLDALSFGMCDAIAHFNNGEKAALDIMELLKIDSGYYMTKSCKSVNTCRKHPSIYSMLEPQKKQKVLRRSKKSNKTKILKLKEPHM